ncbi:hypothetical protein So717_05830 [Roseobacter cerasinus]|uniref:Uncharacterized protein n=1 Tax=Roseobacter cerasinus TaxID=2602289 RepID=A0A640VN25_9RHOB|nr:hypothetical protein [Roseobacter cerasinus]GFE48830.1 hypothetical protein So717_05830 [Roseobacter cerasinus]
MTRMISRDDPRMARPVASGNYALLCIIVTMTIFIVLLFFEDTQQSALLQEGGALETATALIYLVAIALLLPAGADVWPFIVLLLAFCMREFDMDKLLFTEGLFKSRQYIGGGAPLVERLLSGALLLGLIITGILATMRSIRGLARRDSHFRGVTLCVGLGVVLAITSKMADGLGRKLAPFGVELPGWVDLLALTYEEVAEFGMAFSFTVAAFLFMRLRKRGAANSDVDEARG